MDNAQVSLPISTLLPATQVSTLEPTQKRDVLVCPHCRLFQFRTRNSLCRRCHKSLEPVEEECSILEESTSTETPAPAKIDPLEAIHGLGKKVRSLRKGLGLTQKEFSQRMGVPRTYASKVESGRTSTNLDSLQRIATALEVEIRDLLCDERSRREEEIEAIFADDFMKEIVGYLPKLSSLYRALILRAARDAATTRPLFS